MALDGHKPGKFYITTPIYYVNDKPHVGHAYCTIAADVLARYHRLRGDDVLFATGVDEHGLKVVRSADQRGVTPQAHTDEMAGHYRLMWDRMHIAYDQFIRTSDPMHVHAVQQVFEQLKARGDIYLGDYEGWYCVPCETYLLEGKLEDGKCPDCGRPVEQMTQHAYFFRTSKYADRLLRYIEEHPEFIQPDYRRNEVLGLIHSGVKDACVSRNIAEWDIPVLSDDTQSIYVWFDALINYLTVAGYPDDTARMATWWPPQVQLVGKEILPRFHATLWPAMVMALDLPLPQTIFGHGWWVNSAGEKFSKSKGGVPDPYDEIRSLVEVSGCTDAVGVDAMRYFLLREVTFGLDSSYSTEGLLTRFNADLANDLGNLLNRTLPLVERFVDGVVPNPGPGAGELGEQTAQARATTESCLDQIDFHGALEAIWVLISAGNKFVDSREPWRLYKEGKQVELAAVLYDVLDCLRVTAILLTPFMPMVSMEIWKQLGLQKDSLAWNQAEAGRLAPGGHVHRGDPMFPRIDMDLARQRIQGEEQPPAKPAKAAAPKPEARLAALSTISFEEFGKLDLRSGKVLEVEPIKGADKLLRLMVDLGEEQPRQIVAGLAQHFTADELIGNTVIVVANLEPAKLRGVESNGMILAVGDKAPLAIVTADRDVAPGERVR